MENQQRISELETIWSQIVDYGIADDGEIELVTCINGYNIESLNDVIYARTGYHDIEQFIECEIEWYEPNDYDTDIGTESVKEMELQNL